jgi:hypothetical protein
MLSEILDRDNLGYLFSPEKHHKFALERLQNEKKRDVAFFIRDGMMQLVFKDNIYKESERRLDFKKIKSLLNKIDKS